MEILKELLPGCFLIKPTRFEDQRGIFVKTYHEGLFKTLGVNLDIKEEFYSVSRKNVVRGMHFQLPPHAHEKLIYCTFGKVIDVVLDLRKGPGFGKFASVKLSGSCAQSVFIPKGIAHGFMSLSDQTLMLYKTSTFHASMFDAGIRWDSFGFDWKMKEPIVSARDAKHSSFSDFFSPF